MNDFTKLLFLKVLPVSYLYAEEKRFKVFTIRANIKIEFVSSGKELLKRNRKYVHFKMLNEILLNVI